MMLATKQIPTSPIPMSFFLDMLLTCPYGKLVKETADRAVVKPVLRGSARISAPSTMCLSCRNLLGDKPMTLSSMSELNGLISSKRSRLMVEYFLNTVSKHVRPVPYSPMRSSSSRQSSNPMLS